MALKLLNHMCICELIAAIEAEGTWMRVSTKLWRSVVTRHLMFRNLCRDYLTDRVLFHHSDPEGII